MGMPIRIFDSDSDDSSPQRKRRRSSNGAAVPGSATESVVDVSDSDEEVATDSAPDLSMHEVIRRMRSVSQVTRRRLASTRNHLNNETHLPLPLDPVRNAPRSSTATRNPAGRVLTLMQTMPRTLRANIERSARPARADTPAPYDRLNAASEVSLLEDLLADPNRPHNSSAPYALRRNPHTIDVAHNMLLPDTDEDEEHTNDSEDTNHSAQPSHLVQLDEPADIDNPVPVLGVEGRVPQRSLGGGSIRIINSRAGHVRGRSRLPVTSERLRSAGNHSRRSWLSRVVDSRTFRGSNSDVVLTRHDFESDGTEDADPHTTGDMRIRYSGLHSGNEFDGVPHDIARQMLENVWSEGIDFQAMQAISEFYTHSSSGGRPKGQLNLVKTQLIPGSVEVSSISVVYADEKPSVDVGRWWMIGTWAVDGQLTAERVFTMLMDVLAESASIASCKISTLVVCDGLEKVEGVQGGIQLLKNMPSNSSHHYAPSRLRYRRELLGSPNMFVLPPVVQSDTEEGDSSDELGGSFTHPVTGDRINITIE